MNGLFTLDLGSPITCTGEVPLAPCFNSSWHDMSPSTILSPNWATLSALGNSPRPSLAGRVRDHHHPDMK